MNCGLVRLLVNEKLAALAREHPWGTGSITSRSRSAAAVGMSASAFHAHFKAVTAMSPLQFQKHLRLQEARRLLLSENLDAAEAGYRVGYDDQSHFSREYKRHFGEPPMRDVQRLREPARR